ncbi:hypothetical protein ACHAXA_001351, partial [Cyclostephanos tholiformis]
GGSGALLDHRLGLGPHLVGRQICLRGRNLDIVRQLGEGGFSFVYLVRSKVGGCRPRRAVDRAHGDDGGGGGGGDGGFDLSSLVIAFGQICNAVSYLHAQRPPIVHRDLKPVNFLIQRGAYKLCDFGSAIVGHVDLRTPENRRRAEDVIDKTTTPMFRAPEMIDLYMTRRLTESTDVWALGCSLYSMAYHRDCFEEGSALAILSRRYRIPENNPYGDDLVDLIDRMLAWDYKERADMSEVIMCLSALYSNRPLPKRRKRAVAPERTREGGGRGDGRDGGDVKMTGGGSYRTDGQGIISRSTFQKIKKVMPEAKKLDPNSAAAKRKRASEVHKRNDRHVQSIMHESSPRPNDGPSAAATGAAVDDFGFQDFASFDDGGFDGSFDDSMFYDTIEATLEETTTTNNDDCSFPLTFGEKCQISISTSTLGGGKDATSGDFSGSIAVLHTEKFIDLCHDDEIESTNATAARQDSVAGDLVKKGGNGLGLIGECRRGTDDNTKVAIRNEPTESVSSNSLLDKSLQIASLSDDDIDRTSSIAPMTQAIPTDDALQVEK